MFGIGMPEMLLILAIALIVIGPKKLPDLAKSIGRAMGEFKKATNEIKQSMEVDSSFKDVKDTFTEINDDIKKSVSFDTIEDYQPEKTSAADRHTENTSEKTISPPLDSEKTMGTLKEAFDTLEKSNNKTTFPEKAPPEKNDPGDENERGA
jgi:sec-independent protein translocase protein TatB